MLKPDMFIQIEAMLLTRVPFVEIAATFGVSARTVGDIYHGRRKVKPPGEKPHDVSAYLPTLDEIATACESIQATWDEPERMKRRAWATSVRLREDRRGDATEQFGWTAPEYAALELVA